MEKGPGQSAREFSTGNIKGKTGISGGRDEKDLYKRERDHKEGDESTIKVNK